jgi:hypothetical protein
MKSIYLFYGIVILFIVSSCSILDSDPEIEFNNPEITFSSNGTWSSRKSLKIDQDRNVVLLSSYPNLELKLTIEEYSRLVDNFKGFSSITNNPKYLCLDSTNYTISISEDGKTEKRSFESCYLSHISKASSKTKEILQTVITSLNQLADSVYQTKASWIGLESNFYSDKEIYVEGENIELSFEVSNPTNEKKTIYFEQEEQVNFDLHNYKFQSKGNYFTYHHIKRSDYNRDITTEIELDPGETKTINYVWDQVIDENTDTKLQPGKYTFDLYFVTPYLRGLSIDLEVLSN